MALARSFLLSLEVKTELKGRSFVPSVANLKSSSALAPDHDFAVQRAQFDLPDVTTSRIDFFSNQGRAPRASASFAPRNVAASVDANGSRSGVEVRLKHKRAAQAVTLRSWRVAVKRTTVYADAA